MSDVVTRFCEAIEAGTGIPAELFREDATLDATVPNWRFSLAGPGRIGAQLSHWFADPGHFEQITRTPLPDGELVEFTLAWEESGVPFACHQVHVLRIDGGRIASDTAFCGGRWPADLLAEMGEAAHARS